MALLYILSTIASPVISAIDLSGIRVYQVQELDSFKDVLVSPLFSNLCSIALAFVFDETKEGGGVCKEANERLQQARERLSPLFDTFGHRLHLSVTITPIYLHSPISGIESQ